MTQQEYDEQLRAGDEMSRQSANHFRPVESQ